MRSDSPRSERGLLRGLRDARRALRERWYIVAGVAFVTFVIAGISESRRPLVYQATAQVTLGSATPEAAFFGQRPSRPEGRLLGRATRAAKLVDGVEVGVRAGKILLGQDNVSIGPLLGGSVALSGRVNVTGVNTEPKTAAAIANAGARALVDYLKDEDRKRIREAIRENKADLRRVRTPKRLRDLGEKIDIERSLISLRVFLRDPGSATLASRASVPTSPEETQNARIAPAVSFAATLAAILVLLLDKVGRRARGAGRLAKEAEVPLLAAVPAGRRHAARRDAAFDVARASLLAAGDGPPPRRIAVLPLGRRHAADDVVTGLLAALERAGRGPGGEGAAPVVIAAPGPERPAEALDEARAADAVVLSARAGDASIDEVAGAAVALRRLGVEPRGLIVVGAASTEAPVVVAPPGRRLTLRPGGTA